MAAVALVSYDVQTVKGHAGGVGAFVTHFARLLKKHGDSVTIILVSGSPHGVSIDAGWRERYSAWGIELLEVNCPQRPANHWTAAWPAALSEHLAPLLRRFAIVYLQDWANPGFHAIRQRRMSSGASPIFATVLHGPSPWIRAGNRKLPNIPEDLQFEFIERYSAEHSNLVIAPSQYMADWLKGQGWRFGAEPVVLGLPYLPDVPRDAVSNAPSIERIVLFGRLEVRKGFDVFADALRLLCNQQTAAVSRLREVVLLGMEQEVGSVEGLRSALRSTGLTVTHIGHFDSPAALGYLSAHAADALAVIASPFENFPYAVVEALSIPGLNVICSRGGGVPEVFGLGRDGAGYDAQLFEPSAPALAAKMAERLLSPLSADQLAVYDWPAANARWLAFHERACATRVARRASPQRPSLDVCVTYYNKGAYFPQLLRALEAQTYPHFGVIAIDDGSSDPVSRQIFDSAASACAPRGWRFLRQANAFVDAARNRAAAESSAEYLLFVDADDVPALNAIERLIDAAVASGVDCLLSGGYLFDSDEMPHAAGGLASAQGAIAYMPLGPDVVGGLADPMVFGLPMILIRRTVFEQIGGYRERRGAGHEDWELQIRLLLAGYQTDVLPEHLLFFRRVASGLTKTGAAFPAKLRMIEAFNDPLRKIGMSGLSAAMVGLNERCQELQETLRKNVPLELRLQLHRSQQLPSETESRG
jgi:glycosyltransferase involved in cell wall biosynthesis